MRPRELTIEGFRSYRAAATFDWRDRRLVGIVGPIGAGKSSILDAVAFALYGKTPGIGSATKSLIHQQCTEAHVSLTFEVDGQIWQAVRAPKRKGQSGHQLRHLAADEPDAEVLETVTMEGAVNERIAHLLGMDFDTFCRSVLLAQNRFNEFLKATKTDRDKVLKGVFGYERIDAAKLAAERRLDRETMALEAFSREREGIDQARERLEEARGLAEQTRSRLKAFEACAPRVEELMAQEAAARSDAEVASSTRPVWFPQAWHGQGNTRTRGGRIEAGGAGVWPVGRTRPGQGPDRAGRITGLGRAVSRGPGTGHVAHVSS